MSGLHTYQSGSGRGIKRGLLAGLSSLAVIALASTAWAQNAQENQQNFNAGSSQQTQQMVEPIPDNGGNPQQLPEGFAQEQVPSSFSMGDETLPLEASDQIIPAANDGNADNGEVVNAESAPAQPQSQQLVPATAMGQAAQSAQQTQTPNPVEDAAAQADAQQQNSEAPATARLSHPEY